MKIGYACIPVTTTSRTTRKLTLNNYNEDKLRELIHLNLKDLKEILKFNKEKKIYLFRISSDIIPLGSHPINKFHWCNYFKEELLDIGRFINDNSMRVSMHPGQYTVLNSPIDEVVNKSLKDIEYHCAFLDSLNLDFSHKIIIHIGGVYNNKELSIERFITNFHKLSCNSKKRLIIENDEKNFSINDVLYISSIINIPVVFDNLHNECHVNKAYEIEKVFYAVEKTWKPQDGIMKIHYSQQNPIKKLGSHSLTINTNEFLHYLNKIKNFNVDIMLEVKDKEVSAIKCIHIVEEKKYNIKNLNVIKEEFEKYKLLVTEYDYNFFTKKLIEFSSIMELYNFIDRLNNNSISVKNYLFALNEAYKTIYSNLNKREITHFNTLLNSQNISSLNKAKLYLKKLSFKYNLTELISSYYFSQI